ncbi:MAG: 3-dehydroquinate synthase [Kiritimatiellae bacterium]|nr:3-dehydroquinate synthase [Kiritimatiellia bacterium]
MSQEVTVHLGERSYFIQIGPGLLDRVGPLCGDLGMGEKCLVISDSNVDPLYGSRCEESLSNHGFDVWRAVVPAGEASKCSKRLFDLYEMALAHGLDRRSFVVALGGGMVGDLAGYTAASFLRGIRCVQVPTSLLAMVDSSVGGKTGINLPQGKNLVGAFHQPSAVVADSETLKTLPRREYVSGLAEIVKYGVIRDADLFSLLERKADALLKLEPDTLEVVIARCCEIKAEIVEADEREAGLRAILNFGHTLGHAVEHAGGYDRYLHGEAVAIGMAYAARLSARVKSLPQEDCDRIIALLRKFDLPVAAGDHDWNGLRATMAVDKKVKGGTPLFVLVTRIGAVTTGCEVPDSVLQEVWEKM